LKKQAKHPRSATAFNNPIQPNALDTEILDLCGDRLSMAPALRLSKRSKAMRRITFAVAATIILGALIIALPKLKSEVRANPVASLAAPHVSPPSCQNVKFAFKNGRPNETIRVEKIEYRRFATGDWHTESISFASNGECPYQALCNTTGNNLIVPTGARLDQFNLYYKSKPSKGTASWSAMIGPIMFLPPPDPAAQQCMDYKIYGGANWVVR
jgi:hypothetical protein